jgi:hypothetical protein
MKMRKELAIPVFRVKIQAKKGGNFIQFSTKCDHRRQIFTFRPPAAAPNFASTHPTNKA